MTTWARNGIAYELTGPPGRPVVVLIHGLGMTRALWDQHVPAFSETFQVLRYDLNGHGESSVSPETPSLRVFAEQLRDLLDELGVGKVAIVGFSLGGMINRRFCTDNPERVRALAILNSPHERTPEEQLKVEARAEKSVTDGPGSTLDAAIERWFTPEFIEADPDYITWIRKVIMANDPANFGRCRTVLAKGVVELIRPNPPISCPTLVMTCENDSGSTPDMSYGISTEIAGAELHIVPRLQHCGLVEEPNLFIDPILKFLNKYAV